MTTQASESVPEVIRGMLFVARPFLWSRSLCCWKHRHALVVIYDVCQECVEAWHIKTAMVRNLYDRNGRDMDCNIMSTKHNICTHALLYACTFTSVSLH